MNIIVGILNRSQENSVIYGSIDSGLTVAADEAFVEQVQKMLLKLVYTVIVISLWLQQDYYNALVLLSVT